MKSWDLPSEELVTYRYENVTPVLFFPPELACCISVPEAYTQLQDSIYYTQHSTHSSHSIYYSYRSKIKNQW